MSTETPAAPAAEPVAAPEPVVESAPAPEAAVEAAPEAEAADLTADEKFEALFAGDEGTESAASERVRDPATGQFAKAAEGEPAAAQSVTTTEPSGTETPDAPPVSPEPISIPYKVDGEDRSIAVTPENMPRLSELVRQGEAFDTVVARRETAAFKQAGEMFAGLARDAGFALVADASGKVVLLPQNPQVAQPSTAPPDPHSTEMARMSEIEEKAKTSEGLTQEDYLELLQIERSQRVRLEETLRQQTEERARVVQAQSEQSRLADYNSRIDALAKAGSQAFPEAQRAAAYRDAWAHAEAWRQHRTTVEEVESDVRAWFVRYAPVMRAPTPAPSGNGAPAAPVPSPAPAAAAPVPPVVGAGTSPGASETDLAGLDLLGDDPRVKAQWNSLDWSR